MSECGTEPKRKRHKPRHYRDVLVTVTGEDGSTVTYEHGGKVTVVVEERKPSERGE